MILSVTRIFLGYMTESEHLCNERDIAPSGEDSTNECKLTKLMIQMALHTVLKEAYVVW